MATKKAKECEKHDIVMLSPPVSAVSNRAIAHYPPTFKCIKCRDVFYWDDKDNLRKVKWK